MQHLKGTLVVQEDVGTDQSSTHVTQFSFFFFLMENFKKSFHILTYISLIYFSK